MMEGLIEDTIQRIGWGFLKIISAGRYKSDYGQPTRLFEGALGLLLVAAMFAIAYALAS